MMNWLTMLFVFDGFLVIAAAIPFIQRRVKPNPWSGFRTSKTLSNPDIWYAANAYSGRQLRRAGAAITLTALGLRLVPGLSFAVYAVACGIVPVLSLLLAVGAAFRFLRTL